MQTTSEPNWDPAPWVEVDRHTRAHTRYSSPRRERKWDPRGGYWQDPSLYPDEALADMRLSYPVRRAMIAVNRYGYRDVPITFPPVWGYYVTNLGVAATTIEQKMIDVVETQKALSIRAATFDQRDVRLYDATRAFYEYTDPFGAKTYA